MVWKPDYVTLAEARDYVTTDAADDTYLGFAITAASRAIDDHTLRQFGQVASAEARRYTACWDRRRARHVVEFDDLGDVTGLTVAVTAGAVDVFELEPVNALKVGMVYERVVIEPESANKPAGLEANELTITAKWGWVSVPVAVKQATLMQLNRVFARRTSPYGVAGSPDQGSELRLLARVDSDVKVVLGGLLRWWAAA